MKAENGDVADVGQAPGEVKGAIELATSTPVFDVIELECLTEKNVVENDQDYKRHIKDDVNSH